MSWQIFLVGCAIAFPLLAAWAKIRLWAWLEKREQR
jgi:hypothetical protein